MANFHKHWYGTLALYTAIATKDSNTLYHCSEGLIYKGSVLLATRRWGDLSGKPSTFTPSAHTHTKSQITDFPTTWAWASLTGVPSTFTPSAHTHDDRYYTETEVNTLLTNKAKWDNAYGWGNHASAGYALNSALTTHTGLTNNPHGVTKAQVGLGSVNNTADSAKNVLSATKLTTARNINGTSFNGSANITTANWGTSRTLTIGSTGKSVNGSANVSWSLAEIGAAVGDNVSYKHDAGSGARWIRIAEFSHYISYGIISILNSFSNNAPNSVTFYYNSGYRSAAFPSITQIGGRAGIFTKARVVYPTSTNVPGFIEVYYNTTSVGNTLYLRLTNSFNCTLLRDLLHDESVQKAYLGE